MRGAKHRLARLSGHSRRRQILKHAVLLENISALIVRVHVELHGALAARWLSDQEALADLHEVGAHAWVVLTIRDEVRRDSLRIGVVGRGGVRVGAACEGRKLAPEHIPVLHLVLGDFQLLV